MTSMDAFVIQSGVGAARVEVERGWICDGNGKFYVSATCGAGHTHRPATKTTTVVVTEENA